MSRKPFLLAAAAILLAAAAQAAVIRAHSYSLRADLASEWSFGDNEFPPVNVGLGYFPADNMEFGGILGYRKTDWNSFWRNSSVWELGLYGEYHFDVDFPVHPLVGARLSMLDGEESSDTCAQLLVYAGLKYFLSEYLALSFNTGLGFATDDIYDVKTRMLSADDIRTDGKAVGFFFDIGVRFYY